MRSKEEIEERILNNEFNILQLKKRYKAEYYCPKRNKRIGILKDELLNEGDNNE